jgi:hypothetical protein
VVPRKPVLLLVVLVLLLLLLLVANICACTRHAWLPPHEDTSAIDVNGIFINRVPHDTYKLTMSTARCARFAKARKALN